MRYPLASKISLTWAVVLGLQAILRFSEGVCETAEFYTGALNSRSLIASAWYPLNIGPSFVWVLELLDYTVLCLS